MNADGEEVKYATHLARQSLLRIGIFVAILLALLAAERVYFQKSINEASARLTQAAKIKGDILVADEILTMSAYTYANTADEKMRTRYLEAIPEIDAAIAEAKKLASPAVAARFDNETRVANDELVKLEMKSFDLVAQRRMGEAVNIFTTLAYLNNKRVLKEGTVQFMRTLNAELAAANAKRYWVGLSLLA